MESSRVLVIVAGLALGGGGVAAADNKAWKAAQANMPDMPMVIGADVEALAKTSIWAKVVPSLTGGAELKDTFAVIKAACHVDALSIVTSLVVAADPANEHQRVAYLAIPSLGKTKAIACLQAVAAEKSKTADAKDKVVVTAKTDGNIVELGDGKETVYIGFIGDVAVIAPDVWEQKDKVKAWMNGGGALTKGGVGKLLAKVNTGASVWGATTATDQLGAGQGAKQAFGWASIAGGKLVAEAHVDFGDAKVAQTNADEVAKQIADAAASPPLPALKALFAGMSSSRSGTEVVVKENVAESDVAAVLAFAASALVK